MEANKKEAPAWVARLEIRMKKLWDRAKDAGKRAFDWGVEHPDKVLAGGAILAGGAKMALKEKKRADEKRQLECRFYDRRTDTYWWTKRPLKPHEKIELEQRSKNGELKSEILREKGLLKY